MIYFTFYPYASAICLVYSGLTRLKFYGINLAKIFVLLRKPILLALHFKNTHRPQNLLLNAQQMFLFHLIFCFKNTNLCDCQTTNY